MSKNEIQIEGVISPGRNQWESYDICTNIHPYLHAVHFFTNGSYRIKKVTKAKFAVRTKAFYMVAG